MYISIIIIGSANYIIMQHQNFAKATEVAKKFPEITAQDETGKKQSGSRVDLERDQSKTTTDGINIHSMFDNVTREIVTQINEQLIEKQKESSNPNGDLLLNYI